MALIDAVRTVHLAPALQGYMVDLAEASRRHPALLLGLSPRATLQLVTGHPRTRRQLRAASTPPPTTSRPSPSRCCPTA